MQIKLTFDEVNQIITHYIEQRYRVRVNGIPTHYLLSGRLDSLDYFAISDIFIQFPTSDATSTTSTVTTTTVMAEPDASPSLDNSNYQRRLDPTL